MSAIRKLAAEAADDGLLAPELAQGISRRVKSVKSSGIRVRNWLSPRQTQALSAPDVSTCAACAIGPSSPCFLAAGSGVGKWRRSHSRMSSNAMDVGASVDLVGKHGRVRTAPMPTWVKVAVDGWTSPAGIAGGHLFRPINRAGAVTGERLGEKVVWQMLGEADAVGLGVPFFEYEGLVAAVRAVSAAGGRIIPLVKPPMRRQQIT